MFGSKALYYSCCQPLSSCFKKTKGLFQFCRLIRLSYDCIRGISLKGKYQAIPLSASRPSQQTHWDSHCYLNLFPETSRHPRIPGTGHPQSTRCYFPYPWRWLVSCGDLGPKCFSWVLFAPDFLLRLRRRGQEALGRSVFSELLARRVRHGIPQQLLRHKARKTWKQAVISFISHYYVLVPLRFVKMAVYVRLAENYKLSN